MTDPLLFSLAVLALLGTPGPTNTLLAASGALTGVRRSVRLLAAELSGYLVAAGLVRLLLGPLMVSMPLFGIALKLAMAAYLFVLAVRLMRRRAQSDAVAAVSFRAVLVTTLLNPKASIVALAIMPQGASGEIWFWLGFAALVPLMGALWIALGAGLGAVAGAGRAFWVSRVSGLVLTVFAGVIVFSALR